MALRVVYSFVLNSGNELFKARTRTIYWPAEVAFIHQWPKQACVLNTKIVLLQPYLESLSLGTIECVMIN